MAKKETLKELKIRVFRREMRKVGFIPENYTDKEIEIMAMGAFKDHTGKAVKAFGTEISKDAKGDIIFKKVAGAIRERQRAQIEAYDFNAGTFAQQITANSFKNFYNYDVFSFIEQQGITDYDLSSGQYLDPRTGETKSFIGVID